MLTKQQKQSIEYKTGFQKGRANGIWLCRNIILPLPVPDLSKDLSREAARLAGMRNYSKASMQQLKDFLTGQHRQKVLFKPGADGIELE